MKSAIGIGGQIVAVEVEFDGLQYAATCQRPLGRADTVLVAHADSYDGALLALRSKILSAR